MDKLKVVPRNVNNKSLFKEMNDMITEAIVTFGVRWSSESHRLSFIEVIEDYLMDLEEEGKIEQPKVIFDKRNNKSFSNLAKEYVFEIYFRQPMCLNITSIRYHIANRKT